MAVLHEDAQVVGDSDDKVYYFNFTTSTFMKRKKPLAERAVSRMTGNLSKIHGLKNAFKTKPLHYNCSEVKRRF